MTVDTDNRALAMRACLGNEEALSFLGAWQRYVHEIDDIVDGARTDTEDILSTFAKAVVLFSHPFYLKHMEALRAIALMVNNIYADAVAWERVEDKWKSDWADHNRHVGMEMVVAVAQICGGYDHARVVSREQRNLCWHEHHRNGKAV